MSANDNNRNGSGSLNTPVAESSEPTVSQGPIHAPESTNGTDKAEPAIKFATRTASKGAEGISKGKLILLGGGLAVAVLFFVFTAIVGKSPKKLVAAKPPSQQAKQEQPPPSKGSVTPLMDTVRTPAPDNSSGQLGPGDTAVTALWRDGSPFFGVPLTNFVGWYLTAFLFLQGFALYCRSEAPLPELIPRTCWKAAIWLYAICAGGNLLILRLPMTPPIVFDASGKSWITAHGPIEDLHAGRPCTVCSGNQEFSHISDEEMKAIMKSAVNNLYRLLWQQECDPMAYQENLALSRRYTLHWDDPELKKPMRKGSRPK